MTAQAGIDKMTMAARDDGTVGRTARLAPCPCGKTPTRLVITGEHATPKWAQYHGDCCGEWIIEFRNQYNDLADDASTSLAEIAWNNASRGANTEVSGGDTPSTSNDLTSGWKNEATTP